VLVSARVQAALTALVFVLSSLLGVLHEAATTHVRCAQHGELMDGGLPLAGSVPNARDARDGNSASVGDGGATTISGHEHCALASAMRASRIAPCPPALSAAPVVTAEVAIAAAADVAVRDRALYRIAPKTSPPT
jgi:hypothetical protein